tara:strand:- start:345 stop:473 length:129 start_codon:yes stop_codon:yes gene_type:complete
MFLKIFVLVILFYLVFLYIGFIGISGNKKAQKLGKETQIKKD